MSEELLGALGAPGTTPPSPPIYRIVEPVDMRLGIDGLSACVEHRLAHSPIGVMFHALQICTQHLKESELKLAHLVTRLDIRPANQLSLSEHEDLIRIGEQAARDNLDALRTLIASR